MSFSIRVPSLITPVHYITQTEEPLHFINPPYKIGDRYKIGNRTIYKQSHQSLTTFTIATSDHFSQILLGTLKVYRVLLPP